MVTLKDTENHPFGIIIAVSLDSYLKHRVEPVEIPYTKLELRYHDSIRKALDNQQIMGWLHLLRGFTSLSWLQLASIKTLDSTTYDSKRGDHRMHTLLQALHLFTRSLWLGRNDALHNTKETTDAVKYTADSSEIRHYFENPNLLPAEDRHYCSHNLTKLLRSRPSVRRRWLQRVQTARSNMLKTASCTDDDKILCTGSNKYWYRQTHGTPPTTPSTHGHQQPENANNTTKDDLILPEPTTRLEQP